MRPSGPSPEESSVTFPNPNPEQERQREGHLWQKWGPYLSERQWGTVREDYSAGGHAWDYFPHDHARSRAYRWGEDGLGGWSDVEQRICLSLAFWNGADPILKERLFGLANSEANHGEDVKEIYYFLDATPTHAYTKMLYKYPQRAYPYTQLVEESRRRSIHDPEFELIDTGLFDDDRYFDVEIEYAQRAPGELLLCVTAHNRGPEAAELHVLPHVWFRNTWAWNEKTVAPRLTRKDENRVRVEHPDFPSLFARFEGAPPLLFTDNETDPRRHYGRPEATGYFKGAFHEYIVDGNRSAVRVEGFGTKLAAHYRLSMAGGGSRSVRMEFGTSEAPIDPHRFDDVLRTRRNEADAYYADLQEQIVDEDRRRIQRQALAGMIWSKQYYYFDVPEWLNGDAAHPPPPEARKRGRNSDWLHLNNADIISMPDTWEYPWYAAWDLAFHCLPLALVDANFAKDQLVLLTREWFMHPNGQIPAYEWAFGDVNPPVHAWAAWRVFQIDRKQRGGDGDLFFLERVFHKLLLNFTWWTNRKDAHGNHIFQGGFLGLDNIGVFDRSAELPTGGQLDQSDGTAWMAMYSLNLMRIALELALHNKTYEDIATKFFEHFLHIAKAINDAGDRGLWDHQDEFYYDVLDLPGQEPTPLRVRSMVGLIPMFAVETLEPRLLERLPEFKGRLEWFLNYRPDLKALVSHWEVEGCGQRRLLSLLRGHRMKSLLRYMLNEQEFFSPYGVRGLSRRHLENPFRFVHAGAEFSVHYAPGESETYVFGGNSNWRGPVWMPLNYLLVESLQKFHHYYGDDFRIECPTGSGHFTTIRGVADELSRRLISIFEQDGRGRRPVLGDHPKLHSDPHFRDHVPFYEYFHGDTGRGIGASHQTGWTGLVAKLIHASRSQTPAEAGARAGQAAKATPERAPSIGRASPSLEP